MPGLESATETPPASERSGAQRLSGETFDLVRALVERARGDDPTALPQLKALFDRHGDRLIDLGRGDVAAAVKELLVKRTTRRADILVQEARLRMVERLQAELAGPEPSPIERLLAERAALNWLELHLLDERVAGRWGDGEDRPRAADLDRYRCRAQRRYLAALRTLATVRRLAVPVVQLNVAERQVNQVVAAGGVPAAP